MNKIKRLLFAILATIATISCGPAAVVYLENSSPEESGLAMMKITDENQSSVAGLRAVRNVYALPNNGICAKDATCWGTNYVLDISPDGTELAYLALNNRQWNIMVRKAGPQGVATQRSFRNVEDFSWGFDEKFYFGDSFDNIQSQMCSIDAHIGSIMRQLTSNNNDMNPILSKDKTHLFFTRTDKNGAYIWCYDLSNGSLTCCCRGYNPCPISGDEIICVRNSSNGTSELWRVNYEKGIETIILADKNRGFTNPRVSPDGKWIVCQGNSMSTISKRVNLDIFAVSMDGTGFTQLTYHPADDCCPVWSPDGNFIYFISSRANERNAYNIWRMRFDL